MVSGACGAGLVALINQALNHETRAPMEILLAFGALLLLAPATRLLSEYLLLSAGQELVYDLRMRLSERILRTPLRRLERMGPHRLLVALTDDINSISTSLKSILCWYRIEEERHITKECTGGGFHLLRIHDKVADKQTA